MRFLLYFTALLALAENIRAARILGLFPHTGRSHQMVFEPLLQKLAENGHQLTVVSFFPRKNPITNYTDVSLEGISPPGIETLDLAMFENSNKILRATGVEYVIKKMMAFYPLNEMALGVCRKLVDWQPLKEALSKDYDLIFVENFNSDCMLGLIHIYGLTAPKIALSSTGMMPWSYHRIGLNDNPSYVPALDMFATSKMSFLERLDNTLSQFYYKYWFRSRIQVKEQEILEKHFGKKLPDLDDLARNITLLMRNTHPSLNGVRPELPAVVEVGGMHLDHTKKIIPPYMERFMNESTEGVVLVSFGSLIKTATLPKYKEDIIMNALSKLKQRVIWKYEDSGEEGTLIGNVLRVRWIPQFEMLKHHKIIAFVAHGGLLGMTEAVCAGKPMVVMPFYGDQPNNAAQAREVGLAVTIDYDTLSEKALTEALEKVLSPEMRENARLVSSIWHDRQAGPLETAVYWTERVLRWGHNAPLHSRSRDMTFIEVALLDVAGAIILAILALLTILRYTIGMVPRFLTSGKKEKMH